MPCRAGFGPSVRLVRIQFQKLVAGSSRKKGEDGDPAFLARLGEFCREIELTGPGRVLFTHYFTLEIRFHAGGDIFTVVLTADR